MENQQKPAAPLFNEKTHELVSEKELRQQFVRHVTDRESAPAREKVEMTIIRAEFHDVGPLDIEENFFYVTNMDETFSTPEARFANYDSTELVWNSVCECHLKTEVKLMLCRRGAPQIVNGEKKDGKKIVGYIMKFLENMGENVLVIETELGDLVGHLYVNVSPLTSKSSGWLASLDECMSGLETIRNRLVDRYENFLREEREEHEDQKNAAAADDGFDDDDDYDEFECDGSVRPMRVPSAQLLLESAMVSPPKPQLMQNIFHELNECVKTNGKSKD